MSNTNCWMFAVMSIDRILTIAFACAKYCICPFLTITCIVLCNQNALKIR